MIDNIKINSIRKIRSVSIINNQYVFKDMKRKIEIYDYLLIRGFNYFPEVYSSLEDKKEVTKYIESSMIPLEQKVSDIAYLVSILHLDTVFDKKVDLDFIKKIYEEKKESIDKLNKYYLDIQDKIEEELYFKPSNYYLIRNISLIYKCLRLSRLYLDKWYDIEKDKLLIRYAYIHNNLSLEHILESDKLYFISWDKSCVDMPIKDIEVFYRNSYLDASIDSLLSIYEKKFPLLKEEKYLLFSNLLIPSYLTKDKYDYIQISNNYKIITYLKSLYSKLKYYSNNPNNNTNK